MAERQVYDGQSGNGERDALLSHVVTQLAGGSGRASFSTGYVNSFIAFRMAVSTSWRSVSVFPITVSQCSRT